MTPLDLLHVECPTADSIESLSEHVAVAGIAGKEAFVYAEEMGMLPSVVRIHIVVTKSKETGQYTPKVNIILK